MSITVDIRDIGGVVRKLEREVRRRIQTGVVRGAERGRGILVRKTPTDTGHARAAWRVSSMTTLFSNSGVLARLYNDAPHIGIIESGARPHPVSKEGVAAIEAWVRRHPEIMAAAQDSGHGRMLTQTQDAHRVAMGIAWKLRHHGQEPTYFIKHSLGRVREAMAREVARELKLLAKNPPKDGR